MIVNSGKRLSNLVNDILDFSKLKHQDIELQLHPIGLREIVDFVLTLSKPLAVNKPLQLLNVISKHDKRLSAIIFKISPSNNQCIECFKILNLLCVSRDG